MTKAERETVIRWDDEEQIVTVWTSQPRVMKKLERAGRVAHEERRSHDGELSGKEYRLPLAEFRWQPKKRAPMSEARRAALRDRAFLRSRPSSPLGNGQ